MFICSVLGKRLLLGRSFQERSEQLRAAAADKITLGVDDVYAGNLGGAELFCQGGAQSSTVVMRDAAYPRLVSGRFSFRGILVEIDRYQNGAGREQSLDLLIGFR